MGVAQRSGDKHAYASRVYACSRGKRYVAHVLRQEQLSIHSVVSVNVILNLSDSN